VDLETRIEYLEADVLHLRSDYVFLEDGEKKDAIFLRFAAWTVRFSS
jgi:hypothetical protein